MLKAESRKPLYDVDPTLTDEACMLIRDTVHRLRSFGASPADLLARWEALSLRACEAEKSDFPFQLVTDRYRLDSEFSRGGRGISWRFWDTRLGRHIDGFLNYMFEDIPRYTVEALAQLGEETEHVIKILGYGVDEGKRYIVMEMLEGEDLGTRLNRETRLSVQELAPIVRQIASALTKMHQRGLVHRDIKPGEIFLSPRDDEEERGMLLVTTCCPTGLPTPDGLLGTPGYMSPELIQSQTVNPHNDLWSLGVTLYMALTGRPPFLGAHVMEVLSRICTDPVPPPSTVVPDLADDVDAFFARALARSPEERLQSAEELSMAFMKLASRRSQLPSP